MSHSTAPMTPPDLSNVVIRPIKKSDLPALEWDGEYTKFRRVYANLYHDTRSGNILMWVVTTPLDEMVGQVFVMLKNKADDPSKAKKSAYVFSFRVKPQWRNKGIGKRLMGHVEEDLHQRGFSRITLNVAKDNPQALRLYQRLGYAVSGSRAGIWSYKDHEGKIQHVNEPAWHMTKDLSPD